MHVEVSPLRDGPDYAPAVEITMKPHQNAMPWESQSVTTLELDDARLLYGRLGQALKVIDDNADPS